MHESDLPTTTDDTAEAGDQPVADTELDAIAGDLDTVEAAMKALDADDFDGAEALAGSLDASAAASEADDSERRTGAEPIVDSGPTEA